VKGFPPPACRLFNLFAIDDLNNFALGKHPDAKTPDIDDFAKRGVLFASARCYLGGFACRRLDSHWYLPVASS
jgi:hypothetical protein